MTWRNYLPDIHRIAEDMGLVVRPINWWEVPADRLYAIAASGIPGHYPHWSIGRDFEQQRSSHQRGRSTIYEMVCNLDPAQAYMLDENSDMEHVFVAAHVLGHVDLFGRNVYSLQQRLDMDQVLHAATLRFRAYEDEYGIDAVERAIDAAHALKWHVSPNRPAEPRRPQEAPKDRYGDLFPDEGPDPSASTMAYKQDTLRWQRGEGDSDLLRFLVEHAPLEEWERDVLSIVREVGLYLLPQTRVKVLHEGYASFFHKHILRELGHEHRAIVSDARLNAGVAGTPGPGRLNPYWLGLTILEHLDRKGEDVLDVVKWESDFTLISRIDEELMSENEVLRSIWADHEGDWREVRDALTKFAVRLPEVQAKVISANGSPLVLHSEVDVDESYGQPVVDAMAKLWRGKVVLEQPSGAMESKGEG